MKVGILKKERHEAANLRQRQGATLFSVRKIVYVATIDFILSKGIVRAFDKSAKILLTLRRLPKIVCVLTDPNTIALTRHYPGLIYKWQGRYLAKSFRSKQRSQILKFHYEYIANRVNARFYKRLLDGKLLLWQRTVTGEFVAISLCIPEHGREGDLSLILEKDSMPIYELSFTLLPGTLVGIAAAETMFVARIQGRKGQFDMIKAATKISRDISPPYLLMAAAEGLASALDVKFVAGVGTKDQLCKGRTFNYDSFWATFLAAKTRANFYVISIPISGRPLEECNPTHRRRTQRKREFKAGLTEDVRMTFIQEYRKSAPGGAPLEGAAMVNPLR